MKKYSKNLAGLKKGDALENKKKKNENKLDNNKNNSKGNSQKPSNQNKPKDNAKHLFTFIPTRIREGIRCAK